MIIFRVGLLVTMVVYGSAFYEFYDEPRVPVEEPVINPTDNYHYQDPDQYELAMPDPPFKSLLLYKLINSLQTRDNVHSGMYYRPKFSMLENPLAGGKEPTADLLEVKDAVIKRVAAQDSDPLFEDGTNTDFDPFDLKGNYGRFPITTHVVCNSKLCSLRPIH